MHRLDIHSIEGKGNLSEECVWLDVMENISDLSYYLLCDTTFSDEHHISNALRHTFWFPKKSVAQRDWVKLMSKNGSPSTTSNDRGSTTHVLYWGLGHTIWNKDGDCAVLFKLESWKTKRA